MKFLQILVLILGLFIFANAQNATLTGNVYDKHGSLIQYAAVKAKSKDGKEYTTKSNEDGIYEIELVNGTYSIEFSANLFETYTIQNYRVSSAYKLKLNLDVILEVEATGKCNKESGNSKESLKSLTKNKKSKNKKPEIVICL